MCLNNFKLRILAKRGQKIQMEELQLLHESCSCTGIRVVQQVIACEHAKEASCGAGLQAHTQEFRMTCWTIRTKNSLLEIPIHTTHIFPFQSGSKYAKI